MGRRMIHSALGADLVSVLELAQSGTLTHADVVKVVGADHTASDLRHWVRAGFMSRTGERGHYEYSATEFGRQALAEVKSGRRGVKGQPRYSASTFDFGPLLKAWRLQPTEPRA